MRTYTCTCTHTSDSLSLPSRLIPKQDKTKKQAPVAVRARASMKRPWLRRRRRRAGSWQVPRGPKSANPRPQRHTPSALSPRSPSLILSSSYLTFVFYSPFSPPRSFVPSLIACCILLPVPFPSFMRGFRGGAKQHLTPSIFLLCSHYQFYCLPITHHLSHL